MGTAARHPLTIDDTADPVTCLCRFGDGFAPGLGLFGSALHNQLRATVSAERDVQRACEDAPVQRSLDRNLVLDDDVSRIDVQAVHDFLANASYWARGRPLEVVQRLVAEAVRVVGLYDDRRQVGFARASTDGTSYVYLADVYVLPEYRGRGLGIELVREMVENGPLAHLPWLLHTRDAHALYRRIGFDAPSARVMERPRP